MAYKDRPMEERSSTSSSSSQSGDYARGLISSPDINSKGEPQAHSIRDVYQAREVIRTVIQAGKNRSIVNSRILAKVNAERPYDSAKLEAEGLGWKQNFTTKPLENIVSKVSPRFVEAVQGLKYLTDSKLSDKWQNHVEKTETFREEITACIRGRQGWPTLIESTAFNNALFGHTVLAWLDEYSWFPKHFAQDESFVNDGTKQLPQWAQVVVLKEVFLPHELFEHIKDEESARAAGWNVEETIKQINEASPTQIRDRLNVGGTLETWYQNAVRELTIGASYMAGANVIVVYSLLAAEVNGKVSHYRLAGTALEEVFSRDDRFDSPDDCLSFFAFERGNGTLHGSKGIGRSVYELAGMLDRTRNEIVDRSILSGKTLIQGDIKRLHTFKMSVVGATCIIPNGWNVIEQKIEGNIEPFLRLDAYFNSIIDGLVGNLSTPALGGQGEAFRSPAAWNLLAQREEEGKDFRVARFMEQLVRLVQTMQRRICRKDCRDDDAKAVQERLLKIMTREELDELAATPVAGTVADLTTQERQMIVALCQEKKGNPLYNARQLELEDLTARLSPDFANRVLLPANDPSEEAEQTRFQQLEIVLLSSGQPVAVSPRDNDEIHLQVLLPSAQQLAGHVQDGQFHTQSLEAMLAHITAHVNAAIAKGVPKEKLKDAMDLVKNAGPALAQLKQVDQQAQALQQTSAAHDQGQMAQLPPEIAAAAASQASPTQ